MDDNKLSETPLLSVQDLVVEYTSDEQVIHAVNHVSFDLNMGKTIGLIGETGAGKTTIAKTILGVLPDRSAHIKSGKILFQGENLIKAREFDMLRIRGKKIAMIFQDPMTALNPVKRIGDQIAEAISLHGDYTKKSAKEKAAEMLEIVGIPASRYVEYPHQFSGGMKQRVVIAIALACNPELLIADEPTTALDVTVQAQVLEMMRDLRKKFNTSLIMITHDFGIISEMCDSVAVIYAGQILEYGSLEDIFDRPTHPYTKGLFGAIPNIHDETKRLHPIPGAIPDPTNLPQGCVFEPRCTECISACKNHEDVPFIEIEQGHFCKCIHCIKREVK